MSLDKILANTKEEGECLIWCGCLNSDGYPRAAIAGNSNVKVHRLVYQLVTRENIVGKVIRHTCDNPRCINPEHLISGTPRDNVKDMDDRDRRYRKIQAQHVSSVFELKETGLSNVEIGNQLSLDLRRVGEILNGKRCPSGRLTKA